MDDRDLGAARAERVLAADGFVLRRVCRCEELPAAIESFAPDALAVAHLVPGLDVPTVLRHARRLRPGMPIVVYDGPEDADAALACVHAGAADYVVDTRPARLPAAIRTQLAMRTRTGASGKRRAGDAPPPGAPAESAGRRESDRHLLALSRALEQSPVVVMMTDAEGRIVYVNSRFSEVTGYGATEVLGRNPRFLKSGETAPEVYADLWRSVTSGETWTGEFRNRKKNGEVFTETASVSPVKDAGGRITHFVAVKEDVTEKRRAEEAIRRAESRFLQSQKMEAVGRLAGGVAHDFNNLLNVIHGYGELLLDSLPDGSTEVERVRQILAAAERAASFTRQLLAVSRLQVLEPKVLRLDAVVGDMEPMLRRMIGEDVAMEIRRPGRLPAIRADLGQLQQVLMNLVVNARDAMPRGGRLEIGFSERVVSAAEAALHPPAQPGPHAVLSVRDAGVGIPEEVLPFIFEPFFTTKAPDEGTGLGLATVYGIVVQSGGHVLVESAPGAGTTFHVLFPAVNGDDALAEPEDAVAGGDGETVLVVEDDAAVRDLAQALLEQSGYRVIPADGPNEALRALESRDGLVDLVLTDLVMPGMSGKDLAERVRRRWPWVRLLLMSGYTRDVIDRHGVPDSGLSILQKPCTIASLTNAVRRALDEAPRT